MALSRSTPRSWRHRPLKFFLNRSRFMNSTLLRIASVLLFIQASAHTFLGMLLHKSKGPAEDAVVEVMKAYRFNAMGSPPPLSPFYFRYVLFSHLPSFLST